LASSSPLPSRHSAAAAIPGGLPIHIGGGGRKRVGSGCSTPGRPSPAAATAPGAGGRGVRPGCTSIGQFAVEFIRSALDSPPQPRCLGALVFRGRQPLGLGRLLGDELGDDVLTTYVHGRVITRRDGYVIIPELCAVPSFPGLEPVVAIRIELPG